jgi:hypothetical protein
MSEWPLAAWVILIGLGIFVGRYLVLYVHWRRGLRDEQAAEHRLTSAASRLRSYAEKHGQCLPERLENADGAPDDAVAYRPAPSLTLDERLVLLHDARPTRNLLQFPSLRPGRGVVLCSGRILVLTEEAFQQLIAADNRLREKLGLSAIE